MVQWMGRVLGGTWHCAVQKYGHISGTDIEVYGAMIEETMMVAWCYVPAAVSVLSNNTAAVIEAGRP